MSTSIETLARELAEEPTVQPRPAARWLAPTVELFSAAALVGWSWLLLTTPLFGRAAGYAAMASIAKESVWGIGLACIAVAQVAAVVTRDASLRLLGCGGACAIWAFIAVMLSQVNGVKTGGVTYGLLSLFLAWRNIRSDG